MDDSFEDINETEYDDFDYNLDYLISYRYDFEFCGILAVYGITLVIGLLGKNSKSRFVQHSLYFLRSFRKWSHHLHSFTF